MLDDDEDRPPREFAGISDIRDDDGNRYPARVVFDYPREGASADPPRELG